MSKDAINEYIALAEWYKYMIYEWYKIPKDILNEKDDKTYEQIENEKLWAKMRRK